MNSPAWWPPKVGDKLRHFTLHGDAKTGGVKQVDALLRVLAVVEHNGEVLVVTAEWLPTRQRWNYEVMRDTKALVGAIWQDGAERPR